MPQEGLAIIESNKKFVTLEDVLMDSRVSTDAPLSNSSPSNNSFDMQQIAASVEDKMTIKMKQMMNEMKALCYYSRHPVKAVEEDIQMKPPGFNQPNVQNNQSRLYNQAPPYQPPTNQPPINQVLPYQPPTNGVSKIDFESYSKANDANMNNLQMKLDNFQRNQNDFQRSYNDFQRSYNDSQKKQDDFQNLMLGFMQNYHNNNTASTSRSGTLPSQTVTNPHQQINAITTRSGKTLEEPLTPLVPTTPFVSNLQKEPEQNPETSMEKVQNLNLENTAHVPPPEEEESIFMEIPKPKAKKIENDKPSAQHSQFLKMFKQLRLEIGLKDALVEMPKFNKWLSSLLRNKEKLEEIAITTVNAECSAIIMNKVPESSKIRENFLSHKLGLEALTPTRMTLELQSFHFSQMGIAEDVVTLPSTAKALIVLYEEKIDLRMSVLLLKSIMMRSDDFLAIEVLLTWRKDISIQKEIAFLDNLLSVD
ncbi:hypothetical protein Tco_1459546 [Tanacetum coccineum]